MAIRTLAVVGVLGARLVRWPPASKIGWNTCLPVRLRRVFTRSGGLDILA
jgi:hypothetical protein